MGYPANIFVIKPNQNLICPVCLEVFDSPQILPCGHSFCQSCLHHHGGSSSSSNNHFSNSNHFKCPTCRSTSTNSSQSFALQGLIGDLQIHCRNNNDDNNNHDYSSSSSSGSNILGSAAGSFVQDQQRYFNDLSLPAWSDPLISFILFVLTYFIRWIHSVQQILATSFLQQPEQNSSSSSSSSCSYCQWRGKLVDWNKHATDECCLPVGFCDVKGCNFVGSVKDLRQHNLQCMGKHQDLLLTKAMEDIMETKVQKMVNERVQSDLIQIRKDITLELQKELKQHNDNQLKRERTEMIKTVLEEVQKGLKQQHYHHNEEMKQTIIEQIQTELLKQQQQQDSISTAMTAKKLDLVISHQQIMISNFCRSWILNKPDPLYDFVVYREEKQQSNNSNNNSGGGRLLIGIPGPKRTPWEGGLFPLLMDWQDHHQQEQQQQPQRLGPPKCYFPPGLHHVNVYPNGAVSCSILQPENQRGGGGGGGVWSDSLSIMDLMFAIQQLLGHPNPSSPAQLPAYQVYLQSPKRYDQMARETAAMYNNSSFSFRGNNNGGGNRESSSSFLDKAVEVLDDLQSKEDWTLVEEEDTALFRYPKKPPPKEPRVPPLQKIHRNGPSLECACSCCAWAVSYQGGDLRMYLGQ